MVMSDYRGFQGKFGWGTFGKRVRLGLDKHPRRPSITVHVDAQPKICPQCTQWAGSSSAGTNCRTPQAVQRRKCLVS